MLRTSLLVLCVLAFTTDTAAQTAAFVVRHAERADAMPGTAATMAADPDLSDAGRARAESLAAILKDAGVTAIFVTEYKRTQQTAAPLAAALGLTPVVVAAADTPALVARVNAATGHVLVVGHSNTVPEVLNRLSVANSITIADDEYDNLFIVPRQSPGAMIRLRYR